MPIDRFLKNKAKKADQRFELRTFCAHIENSSLCIGYYALQVGTDSVADLPGADKTYLINYIAFPAVHLAYLGVHEEYRRQGLGSYALTLQSLDDASTAFYKSLSFAIYSENLKQPKMLYPLADILILVGD